MSKLVEKSPSKTNNYASITFEFVWIVSFDNENDVVLEAGSKLTNLYFLSNVYVEMVHDSNTTAESSPLSYIKV